MRRLVIGLLVAGLIVTGPAGAAHAASGGWSRQNTPDPAGGSMLSVSCVSATACTGTGTRQQLIGNLTIYATLAWAWNGKSWSIRATPSIPHGTDSFLRGVSCLAGSFCAAVGQYWNGTSVLTLAENWNGTNWSIEPTPQPANSISSYLFGVSCVSASACVAVGDYLTTSGLQEPLAELWNGTSWSLEKAPAPAGAQATVLLSVSCVSAQVCTAVGQSTDGSGRGVTLAENWNGTSWSLQPTPDPVNWSNGELIGVSCNAAAVCSAVGFYAAGTGPTVTLAEVWNGTSWFIHSTPNPAGAVDSYFSGISCSSAKACTASGYYYNGQADATAAEAWNGTKWSIQPTAAPAGAVSSFLSGVSCTSATACTAGGDSTDVTGMPSTLAERYSSG
jgi:hypothetical protein